jgi:GcrA cell cycle regulator
MSTQLVEWNETRVDQLRRLWAEGFSASIIARKIGSATRNAIIGKVHRLGLPARRARVRVIPERINRICKAAIASPWRQECMSRVQTPQRQEPPSLTLSVASLTPCTCRWPHGDPKDDDFGFCGQPVAPGSSYCRHHAARAHK